MRVRAKGEGLEVYLDGETVGVDRQIVVLESKRLLDLNGDLLNLENQVRHERGERREAGSPQRLEWRSLSAACRRNGQGSHPCQESLSGMQAERHQGSRRCQRYP